MAVLVCIVNYRTPDLTVACLESLAPEVNSLQRTRVTVVEGGSGDDSADRIASAIKARGWGSWCTLLPLAENRGFAAGNNAAIAPALAANDPPDYVFLLNPDTTIFPGAVGELVNFMEDHPEAGIAGSRVENPDGTVRRSAFRFPTIFSELMAGMRIGLLSRFLEPFVVAPDPRDETHQTHWVSGAAMMVRRAVFEQVGLMDDAYFLYYEETDFTLRAHRAGWQTWYVPASRIVHFVGQSTGATGPQRLLKPMPPYWFASRRRYFVRNHGWAYALGADLCWLFGHAVHRIRMLVAPKEVELPPRFFRDFVRYNFLVRR